jgi:hypothetical protein
MKWRELDYKVDENGGITLPVEATPFDGSPVLIQTDIGVVEAWWDNNGFDWVCYDDMFTCELEDVIGWTPLEG